MRRSVGVVVLVGFILTFAANARAESDGPSLDSWALPSNSSTATLSPPSRTRSRWSVLLPSFVVHGIQPDGTASESMPRKMDESGTAVVTPGLGIQYEGDSSFMLFAAVFKDCYDDLAGALQVGQFFRIGQWARWGYTVGLYARETPISCTRQYSRFGESQTVCESLDDYSWKFVTIVNNEFVDIIPMPFLHFSAPIIKTRDFEMDIKIASNFLLNEFGVAVPF